MGDNLVPNGLPTGCRNIPRLHGADPLLLGTRVRRQPRAPKGAPLRASGVELLSVAKQMAAMPRMSKTASRSERRCRTGDIGDGLRAEWVIEGLQGLLLQVEVSQIVVHEADEPNALVDFLDAELLSGQHG